MSFGERIKTVRKDKKLTQEKLADLCDTSEAVIRSYEKSRRVPNLKMLIRLCNALNVSPNYLLQDEIAFNPYNDENRLLQTYSVLTPSQKDFFEDFLNTLEKNENI